MLFDNPLLLLPALIIVALLLIILVMSWMLFRRKHRTDAELASLRKTLEALESALKNRKNGPGSGNDGR